MTLIIDRLWLGDKDDALVVSDKTMVVNCTKHLPFASTNTINIRLPINDPGLNCSLDGIDQQIFITKAPAILDKIQLELENGGRVLVHCHVGAQRSAALVLLYLIMKGRWQVNSFISKRQLMNKKFDKGFDYIVDRRPVAFFGGQHMSMVCAVDYLLKIAL